jgi:HPt (histidine-containing phosphotransfer) domain-containing protein
MSTDPVGFVALYREYLADAWQSLQVLSESLSQLQFAPAQAKAHYLKSSSLVLGAGVVAQYASKLEQAAILKNSPAATALLNDMQQALREVQNELAKRLGAEVIPQNAAAA